MPLVAGTRMGPYEILAALGSGGMGEVYRARDTRLGREVAIKVLRCDGHARLLQEAQAVSALNHPNILALHDICSENGSEFLVMELVRGKTLDRLIGNRGLGVNEAVKYAIPIADALARAHAAGILHRDLKPSNIMITGDGTPKILDFGLAQAADNPRDGDETCSLTGELIAGTAAYMSPEQAEGKKLDGRSDIFSFGAVLYEMITGRRAFRGSSTASTLAAVLHRDPDPPASVPKELERIIQRCLRKDPNRRFQHMSDLKVELEEVREESESGMQPVQAPVRKRRLWIYAVALLLLILAAAAAQWWLDRTQLPLPSTPIPLTAYEGDQLWPDFSPDGNQVVFAWNGGPDAKFHLYVKIIGVSNHLQLTSGEGDDMFPAWSPDGRWIAFQRWDRTGSHTMLISSLGGPERKVADGVCEADLATVIRLETAAFRLSWSRDGRWLACSSPKGSLVLVSASGGEMRRLTSPPVGQRDVFPGFSPRNNVMLFERTGSLQTAGSDLYLLNLNDDLSRRGAPHRITNEHASALARGGLAWTVDGREVIWSISKTQAFGADLFRVPVFGKGALQPLRFVGRNAYNPVVASHQNRLVYVRVLLDVDIWRTDGRITERHPVSSTEIEYNPQFSPDGKRIAFESNRSGPEEIWVAKSDGTEPVQLTDFGRHCGSPRWSPDGHWITFDALMDSGRWDIWIVDSNGGKPRQLTKGPGSSIVPSFSREGKWIYFGSDRTGRSEIFRVPFGGGQEMQITHSGGDAPQGSTDGRTIYYSKDQTLWEMRVAGTEEHPLGVATNGRLAQVMADGIYFITRTGKNGHGREIRFYEFATHRSRLIQDLGEVNTFSGLAVSPDRKTFLYSVRQENGSNLMLVENFR